MTHSRVVIVGVGSIGDQGITLGCNSDGTLFCPKQVLSRAQMASFLARALNLDPIDDGPVTDSSTAPNHESNINAIADGANSDDCWVYTAQRHSATSGSDRWPRG